MGILSWINDKTDRAIVEGCQRELIAIHIMTRADPRLAGSFLSGLGHAISSVPELAYILQLPDDEIGKQIGLDIERLYPERRDVIADTLIKVSVAFTRTDAARASAFKLVATWVKLAEIARRRDLIGFSAAKVIDAYVAEVNAALGVKSA